MVELKSTDQVFQESVNKYLDIIMTNAEAIPKLAETQVPNSRNNNVVYNIFGPYYNQIAENHDGTQIVNLGTRGISAINIYNNIYNKEEKTQLTWARFAANYVNTIIEFEHLCTDLFKREYFSKDTEFASIPNNPGLEFHPKMATKGKLQGKRVGFQAKYFMGAVGYSDIKGSAVNTIKNYHNGRSQEDRIEAFILYCNQPISQSDESGILKGNRTFFETKQMMEHVGISIVVCAGNDLLNHIQEYPELVRKYFFV